MDDLTGSDEDDDGRGGLWRACICGCGGYVSKSNA